MTEVHTCKSGVEVGVSARYHVLHAPCLPVLSQRRAAPASCKQPGGDAVSSRDDSPPPCAHTHTPSPPVHAACRCPPPPHAHMHTRARAQTHNGTPSWGLASCHHAACWCRLSSRGVHREGAAWGRGAACMSTRAEPWHVHRRVAREDEVHAEGAARAPSRHQDSASIVAATCVAQNNVPEDGAKPWQQCLTCATNAGSAPVHAPQAIKPVAPAAAAPSYGRRSCHPPTGAAGMHTCAAQLAASPGTHRPSC